ncbi:MAG: hypothetical protein FJ316_09460 [SAR202 cluster bacterium]|nr:hypothetical protein [SAR202 cluster bacterium]
MQLSIEDGRLVINLSTLEKILSVRGSLRVALQDIDKATTETPKGNWAELRAPGSYLPGVVKAGTYYTRRGKEFWCVFRGRRHFLTVHLKRGSYRRIILSMPTDEGWAEKINALAAKTA